MPIAIVVGEESEIRANRGQLALTTTQAAARLGISERGIRRFVTDGKLTPYDEQLGRYVFFLVDDVEKLRNELLRSAY